MYGVDTRKKFYSVGPGTLIIGCIDFPTTFYGFIEIGTISTLRDISIRYCLRPKAFSFLLEASKFVEVIAFES
jgi:hypothetical protein